jgi:cytochrome c-type biogenesis protein CcmH
VIAALILVANLLVPQQATAPRDSLLEAQVHQVGSKLRCPVCQGLSVAASPSAHDMREVIRSQLKAGKTPTEVEAYFVSKYGEWILLRPEPRGFNLALYILPAVMVIAGIGLIYVLARKWSRAGGTVELETGVEENAELPAGNRVEGG